MIWFRSSKNQSTRNSPTHPTRAIAPAVTRKGRPIYPSNESESMNPKLVPIIQRITESDVHLRYFVHDDLPQSARAFIARTYGDELVPSELVAEEESGLISREFGHSQDNRRESFRADSSPDSSRYYLYEDGSLEVVTNAYQEIWADAQVFVVERILPSMRLSLIDAELLRALDSDHVIESIRADFFHAFAETLHKQCGIPHSDARGHWNAYARQLGAPEAERVELGGFESGRREGLLFAETFRSETVNA
jgi:hypothetical protein